jgi:phage portal protein BeeE
MGIFTRLRAAIDAFSGKVPQGKAEQHPLYLNFNVGTLGQPTQNSKVNHQMLRNFSENAVVRRAIDYIRNQVCRLAWDFETILLDKKLTADQKRRVQLLKDCLSNPNPNDDWMTWIGQLIEDSLVIGQSYTENKEFTGHEKDHPYLWYPVDAASVQVYLDWDGDPRKPRFAQFDLKGRRIDLKTTELFEMVHNKRSNTPFGLSPVEVAVHQIQYLLEAQNYAGKTASNATPKKLLSLGSDVGETQVQAYRRYFKDEIEGRSHLPIIGGTEDPKSIELGHTGDQALFLQWQAFLIGIIASTFNLDAMKFNLVVGINRSTGDTLDDVSDEGAIRPMAQQIEYYINRHIVPLFGLDGVVKFRFQYTTSFQDRKSLSVIHQIYLQAETMTINEARREIGLPPLPYSNLIGMSKGDLTVSEYRAIFGGTNTLQDSVGVDSDTKTENPIREEMETNAEKTKHDMQEGENGSNRPKNETQDPNNNGGNNGVHGAPKPKEKSMNQRNDRGLDNNL